MPHINIVIAIVSVRIEGILRVLNAGSGAITPCCEPVVRDVIERVTVGVARRGLKIVAEIVACGKCHSVVVRSAVRLQLGDVRKPRVGRRRGQADEARGIVSV